MTFSDIEVYLQTGIWAYVSLRRKKKDYLVL